MTNIIGGEMMSATPISNFYSSSNVHISVLFFGSGSLDLKFETLNLNWINCENFFLRTGFRYEDK